MKINDVTRDMKLDLMNNFRDKLQEIDLKIYVDEINPKWDDVSTMTLTVPSRLNVDGRMVDNSDIYRKFKGKKQQLILSNPDIRFVIDEISTKKEKINGKFYNEKTIKCKSFESTLDIDLILEEDIVRQLYNSGEDSLDVSEGILNMFESKTGWKVKYVSEDARKTFSTALIQKELSIGTNYNLTNMQREEVIWEKDFNIPPYDEHSTIGLNIVYSGLKTINSEGKRQMELAPFSHTLSNLYTTIKHIKAMYTKNTEGIYGVTYEITYADGNMVKKVVDDFVFCDSLTLQIDEIKLGYTTGETEETMAIKYAVFEQGTYKWLEFLRKTVSKAYDDLYFDFDTINKEVSVYLKSEYGENHGGIIFSYDTFVSEINEVEQSDEIITKLYVNSQQTSIIDVNPLGTEYLYCFDYFINNGLMDNDLVTAWRRFENHVESTALDSYNLRVQSNTVNKDIIALDSKITALDYTLGILTRNRASYQTKNNNNEFAKEIKELSEQIIEKQTELESILTEKAELNLQLDEVTAKLKVIVASVQLETAEDSQGKIFTDIQLQDINDLMITQTVEDSNFVTSNGLYEYYKEDLIKRNKCHINFEITSEDFLQNIIVPKQTTWDYYLEIGNYVYTDDEDIIADEDNKLRIVSYKILPKNNDVTDIELNNRDKQIDEYSGGAVNLKSDVGRTNGYVNMFNSTWKESPTVNSFMRSIWTNGLDAQLTPLRNRSHNCKFDFAEYGLIIYGSENENNKLMLTENCICFTDDNFLTSNCCLNESGLVAKYLYGAIILGEQLYISSGEDELMYIGNMDSDKTPNKNGQDFGIVMKDQDGTNVRLFIGLEKDADGIKRVKMRMISKDGQEVVLSDEGILNTNFYEVWDNVSPSYPITTHFPIGEGVSKIKEVKLKIRLENYRGFTKSVAGGGTSTTTGGSTNVTSSGGGDHNHALFTGRNIEHAPSSTVTPYKISSIGNTNSGFVVLLDIAQQTEGQGTVIPYTIYTATSSGNHTHDNAHEHTFNFYHIHDLVMGIFMGTKASGCILKVNGETVLSNINTDIDVDITNYVKLNMDNKIEISSNTNGRISLGVSSKMFTRF